MDRFSKKGTILLMNWILTQNESSNSFSPLSENPNWVEKPQPNTRAADSTKATNNSPHSHWKQVFSMSKRFRSYKWIGIHSNSYSKIVRLLSENVILLLCFCIRFLVPWLLYRIHTTYTVFGWNSLSRMPAHVCVLRWCIFSSAAAVVVRYCEYVKYVLFGIFYG